MNQSSGEPTCGELKVELEALRQKIENFEALAQAGAVAAPARKRSSKARALWLLLAVVLVAVGLVAAVGDNALFINPQGYVGINTTRPEVPLDVNGNTRLGGDARVAGAIDAGNSDLYFTNPNHEHTGKGNTQGYAAIENAKGYNALMILGRTSSDLNNPRYIGMWDRVGIGMGGNDKPRAALDVRGDVVANNVQANNVQADNVWVKLHEANLNTGSDYTITGLNGNAYRRFRIEVEGGLDVGGADRTIGLRPNGAATGYGPGMIHYVWHVPGDRYGNDAQWFGGANSLLPLCSTNWNQNGQVQCTAEMNTRTGMYRMIVSEGVFNTANTCGASTCMAVYHSANSWRDVSTNITSLTLSFNGASRFWGRVVLYGKN
jgi:hypothetical protein